MINTNAALSAEMTGTVALPLDAFTDAELNKLRALIASKSPLLKKALGTEDLFIITGETTIEFPWIQDATNSVEVQAVIHLVNALADLAKKQKRINTTRDRQIENEKYAFRCFLLRLGFIGDEYKAERKLLLRHLEGSASFKTKKEAV